MKIIKDKEKICELLLKWHIDCLFDTDISSSAFIFKYGKNENICNAGDDMPFLLFIVNGRAKVYSLLSNGKMLSWCYYSGLSVLGEVELCKPIPAMSTAVTLCETWCIAVPMEVCRAKTSNNIGLWKYLTYSLGMKLSLVANNSAYNQIYPLETRLASYILGTAADKRIECNLMELAQVLGVSYRHLHRVLRNFKEDGILEKYNCGYIILKPDILQKLVKDAEMVLDFSCRVPEYLYNTNEWTAH